MTPEQQKLLLITQVKSMVAEVSERLGDDNPWTQINFDEYDVSSLAAIKRMLHELLYAPPPRVR